MWSSEIEASVFARLINGALVASKEAHMTCEKDILNVAVLHAANTLYGNITVPATVTGEMCIMPLDMLKIAATLPTTGNIKLSYDDNILSVNAGRSRYKFYQFAENAVRVPPSSSTLIKDLPNVINSVDIKELYDANNKILKMSELDGSLYKTIISLEDSILSISDKDGNIVTDVVCESEAPSSHVMLSSAYLESVLLYIKKHIGEPITIQMYTPESPCTFRYSGEKGTIYYLVAPIVET